METVSTCVGTVIPHESDFPPSVVVTLITAVPSFFAVTRPSLFTVATVSSELLHTTDLSVAFNGNTQAFSCFVSFFSSMKSDILFPLQLMETLPTDITTSILHSAV